ncbi:O-antigen translocase [Aureispira anguillae]|uniref:O-antigen translocase n=1 Tax=Aureispira anguillae TaxID=2864201 RepID=A0A915YLT2_9BACT|nr:O-antigen translocase [Aureispira anguillae]BDS15590.1 O-antigen translocase [Aureispira anguillae]
MNLKSTTFWSAIYTVIRMLSGIISIKVVAYMIGPAGVAYVGQFQNFLTITNSSSNMGIGQGTIKYLAEHRAEDEVYKKILSTSFIITIVSSSLISILILLFHKELSVHLFHREDLSFILIVLALSISIYSSGQILMHALNGFQEIKKLITARILTSLLGLVSTIALVLTAGVEGALLALIISQIIGFGVLIYYSKTSRWFSKSNFLGGWDAVFFKKLGHFSIMTFVSVILLNIRQIYLRDYIIIQLSPEAAGYWQAIWKISELYLTVITFSLSVYYLPKLSEIKEKKALREEIFKGYQFLIPIVLILSVSIFVLRDLIIYILFTPDFSAVRDLFFYQLIGDVFKIASWILSFLMVAKAMTKTFIITEIIFIGLFAMLSLFGVQWYGLVGMTYAFALTYILYFFTMLFIFKDILFTHRQTV